MVRTRPRGRGTGGAAAVLLGVVLTLVTACSGSGKAEESDTGGAGDKPGETPAVAIEISPEDGATDVATSGALRVTADGGTLTGVTVTGPEGEAVSGRLTDDGAGWEPQDHLANDTTYSVLATGENADGAQQERSSSFTTLAADATFQTRSDLWHWIDDGEEVGVGTIISVTFDTPIENTARVRDAIEVVTEPAVEVRGHWFGNQRLDFRPETYWEPGTTVTVRFRTRGVEGADGVYGTRSNDRSFVIGRHQVSTVDAAAKTMTVVRDGELLREVPVSTGAPGTETWNGKMVIYEKFVETRMNGDTVGFEDEYDLDDVPHAMRLSRSGTFVHGNYWTPPHEFGAYNRSHGCIGLEDKQGADDPSKPGAWFYDNSVIGDVVEVVNSEDEDGTIAPDNGWSGWNMEWAAWGAGQ